MATPPLFQWLAPEITESSSSAPASAALLKRLELESFTVQQRQQPASIYIGERALRSGTSFSITLNILGVCLYCLGFLSLAIYSILDRISVSLQHFYFVYSILRVFVGCCKNTTFFSMFTGNLKKTQNTHAPSREQRRKSARPRSQRAQG